MRERVVMTLLAGAMLFAEKDGYAQDADTSDELEQVKESLTRIIMGGTTSADIHDTNGFHIESSRNEELGADFRPTGARFDGLFVTAEGTFNVAIEKGRAMSTGGGVGIFHGGKGTPMMSVADRDGDGRLDIVTYAVVDENGDLVLDVVDYEADGQADMRVNYRDHYFELWHADRWHRVENRDGRRGIVVDGEFVELKKGDNRWVVP